MADLYTNQIIISRKITEPLTERGFMNDSFYYHYLRQPRKIICDWIRSDRIFPQINHE